MSWASESAEALLETFAGAFEGEGVALGAAAVAADGVATARTPDCPEDGLFELGSVTKPLTATLLAALAGDGVVGLDDEVGCWLDAGRNGGITLRSLATHSSGLPRLAPGIERDPRFDPANPYASFGAVEAERALRETRRSPQERSVYSNFGFQVLGLALERAAGVPYGELLSQRLLAPLRLTHAGVGACARGTRLPGHAGGLEVVHWDQPLPAAGGVEATIEDLARFLQAALDPPAGPLGEAIRRAQVPARAIHGGDEVGLGWLVRAGRWRWHNGGTGGFGASIGVDPVEGRALGMLANAREAAGVLDDAVARTLEGRDPREARPDAAAPRFEEQARALAAELIEGAYAAVHARLVPGFAAAVGPGVLREGWEQACSGLGEPGEVSVVCRPLGAGAVGALVTIAFGAATVSIAIAFASGERVTGLKLLRPGERFPW